MDWSNLALAGAAGFGLGAGLVCTVWGIRWLRLFVRRELPDEREKR